MKPNPFSSVTAAGVQSLVDDAAAIRSLHHDLTDLIRWRDAGLPIPRGYGMRVSQALDQAGTDLTAVAPGAHGLPWTSLVFDQAVQSVNRARQRDILSESKQERILQMINLQSELELAAITLHRLAEMLPPLIPLGEKANRWLTTDRMRLRELPARRRRWFYTSAGVCAYSVVSWAATIFVAWYPQTTRYFPPFFLLLVSTPRGGQALPGILPPDVGLSGLVEAGVLLGAELLFVAHFIDLVFKLHHLEVDFERRWQDELSEVARNEERLLGHAVSRWRMTYSRSSRNKGRGRYLRGPRSDWW